jgi:hypothetical protein
MTPRSSRIAALYLGLVFLAGGALGFSVNQFYSAQVAEADDKPCTPLTATEYRSRLIATLDAQLNLDDDQESEILMILDQIGERWGAVRDAMEPEFGAIRQERAERIMAILTPGQQTKYAAILEERARLRDAAAHSD